MTNLFLLGFISLGYQIVILREFLVVFSDNEITIGIFLASWMMMSGLGSYLAGFFINRLGSAKKIFSYLRGIFNIYNILAAATYARTQNVSAETVSNALSKLSEIPGRVQSVRVGSYGKSPDKQYFDVIVDYAHTPDSLRALYEAFKPSNPSSSSGSISNKKLICVLGNTGGGRDTWKRPEMGKIADQYCDEIILTNEDPYDEDPRKIVDEMAIVIRPEKLTIEMDRRKAIRLAIKKASDNLGKPEQQNNCIVLLTGKGTDPYIMGPKGAKTQWDDKTVAEEELRKLA